jgi:hypothetical protein
MGPNCHHEIFNLPFNRKYCTFNCTFVTLTSSWFSCIQIYLYSSYFAKSDLYSCVVYVYVYVYAYAYCYSIIKHIYQSKVSISTCFAFFSRVKMVKKTGGIRMFYYQRYRPLCGDALMNCNSLMNAFFYSLDDDVSTPDHDLPLGLEESVIKF